MLHVILGLIAISLGVWGITSHWWAFLDLMYVLLPVLLVIGGAIAITAGISRVNGKESVSSGNPTQEGLG